MQLLLIHADFIEFEAKRPTKMAEHIEDSAKKGRLEEALCVFIAVEKFDEDDPDAVIAEGVKQITDVVGQVHATRIMLYPYAHLSAQLSTPTTAIRILKGMQAKLSDNFEVMHAPFGWYKAFTVSCKGHPLVRAVSFHSTWGRRGGLRGTQVRGQGRILLEGAST